MKGRWLSFLLAALLLVAAIRQTVRGRERLKASALLYEVEAVSLSLLSAGQAPRVYLQQNIRNLRVASELDPLDVGIPLALGSQFLLLGSHQAAIDAYSEALALEPRPEIYLNLGKALYLSGHPEEARKNFDRAVALDWHLESEVPEPELRSSS
ncbi:MAG: tetratricopeptide repeat protein [Acidobacteria bacterium]|nr:tetratricopeptide repeat protein [Acidobacteriota bacterium]